MKLFCGIIYREREIFEKALKILERRFGMVDKISDSVPFNQTDYYTEEMGSLLLRQFVSFKRLIKRDDIVSAKIFTNKVEEKFSDSEKRRRINIDPGFITLSNVCLATTKDFQHRIWIGKGIYLENTLRLRKGRWTEWEWTYPDYKTDFAIKWFGEINKIYREDLRNIKRKSFTKDNF